MDQTESVPGSDPGPLCPECRQTPTVAATAQAIPYRCLGSLKIPSDCPRSACPRCGAFQITEEAREELERAFRGVLRIRARAALKRLEPHITKKSLEHRLGLSHGWLCNVKAGRVTPSPALVSTLAIIAADPIARLRDLERYWAEPPYE